MLPKNRQNIDVISLQDSRCQDTKLAGGKGSNLAVMTHIAGLNTKPGWVVTCEFYLTHALSQIQELLISLNNLTEHDDINKTFAKIRSIILNLDITSIDHPLEKELIANVPEQEAEKHYAVRSSANVEDGNLASFSGKFETELYVKKKNLSQAIKRVWASMFTLNNFEYCKENGISLENINMAVVIQEMSNPLAAGTVFANEHRTEIDVAPGLGEAVVRGDKPTDKVVLAANNDEIIYVERSIKKTKLVYSEAQDKVVDTPLSMSEYHSLSLTNNQVKELNAQVQLLKKSYQENLNGIDVEFSCDKDGRIYILQVRPITIAVLDNIQQVNFTKNKAWYIGKGDPVSYHVKSGILAICHMPEDAESAIMQAQQQGEKVIIVTANTTSQWESVMRRSAGVIAETGSTNCHTAIACREMKIAGITGYEGAMGHLVDYNGKEITLCGPSGRVYKGNLSKSANLVSCLLETKYVSIETENLLPVSKHLDQASKAHMIKVYDGINYIGKPLTATSKLINDLDLSAHQHIEHRLDLPKTTYLTIDKTLLMNFNDCHQWRVKIREWSLKQHQDVLELRKNAEAAFQAASNNLTLTEKSIQNWFDAYEDKIGFDNIAFPIGEILNGFLHSAAKEKNITEPILSEIIPAEIACMGHFELEKCNDFLREIQSIVKLHAPGMDLLVRLASLYSGQDISNSKIREKETELLEYLKRIDLFERCQLLATSYRIKEKDFSLTFLEPWFQQSSTPWLRLLVESNKLTDPAPQPLSNSQKVYFPEDKNFRSIVELVAASKKLHMDGHQTKARGLWKFIRIMQELSLVTGYPIVELLEKSKQEIISIVMKLNLQSKTGEVPRKFSAEQEAQFREFERSKDAIEKIAANISNFCASLPTAAELEKNGYQQTVTRIVFPSNNTGLPLKLEEFEDQMSDESGSVAEYKYRGEYVRPNRHDFTQHQVSLATGSVVTMVAITQGKPCLTLMDSIQIGKSSTYSADFKWENPAFLTKLDSNSHSGHYDKIINYSELMDKFISGFSKQNIDEKYLQLQAYLMNINRTESFFSQPGHQYLPMMQELLTELEQEQHTLAMTGKASTIIYGKDSVTPKMQPVVRIPAKDQHERFLEDTLIYINKWLNLVTPIDENYLFKMNKDQFDTFLDASGISDENKTIFYTSLKSAEKFREYQRKPKLQVNLDNNSVVEVSMNDSIDIPSQALMIITDETNATETNRPVNLISGYRALSAILSKYYAGENQDIILSNLAYTQASSTPSMCHFHLVPAYNSEGKFIIPYLDSNVDEVDCYKDTCIDGVEVHFLPHEESDHRFNLVKFKIKLDSDEAVNVRRFEAINQKLQKWETQTGCDMTWVAKFSAKQNTVVMCVELRAGINQFTLNQIDDFNRRQLWGKIGFTEVMGKKYSMLTQSNLNNAVYIFNHLPQLRETMLNTPLYCLQVSPDDKKTFYNFEDIEVSSEQIEAKTSKSFIHIARLLQAYDADIFTKTMAEMYRLHEDELNELKDILKPIIINTFRAGIHY